MKTNTATYCPEDNKLRLYVGRVPRDEYERLRDEGWTSTPKQNCDFVAHWTPERAQTCLEYADLIEDEDQSPEERAADRAERFGEYRDKRTNDATGHADRFSAQPLAHGFQNTSRAERAAARHDRIADRATDAWSKAEYWQRRTAGVISHALYKSTPAVRMGRIKELEALIRGVEKTRANYESSRNRWLACVAMTDTEKQDRIALTLAYVEHGDYTHPRTGRESYLYDLGRNDDGQREPDPLSGAELCALYLAKHGELGPESEWLTHYRMRLAYENQMLEAQGGRAAFVEMEVGGWVGSHQIHKVNKSNATGRVVSVGVMVPTHGCDKWGNPYPEGVTTPTHRLEIVEVERMAATIYRAPSDEERAAFLEEKKAAKKATPKKEVCPLINPTDEDAERLQVALNAHALADHCKRHLHSYGKDYASDYKPSTVLKITQAQYSAASGGAYARAETRGLCKGSKIEPRASNMWSSHAKKEEERRGPAVCKIRVSQSNGSDYGAKRVIILTDKPQKPLPAAVWAKLESEVTA